MNVKNVKWYRHIVDLEVAIVAVVDEAMVPAMWFSLADAFSFFTSPRIAPRDEEDDEKEADTDTDRFDMISRFFFFLLFRSNPEHDDDKEVELVLEEDREDVEGRSGALFRFPGYNNLPCAARGDRSYEFISGDYIMHNRADTMTHTDTSHT